MAGKGINSHDDYVGAENIFQQYVEAKYGINPFYLQNILNGGYVQFMKTLRLRKTSIRKHYCFMSIGNAYSGFINDLSDNKIDTIKIT